MIMKTSQLNSSHTPERFEQVPQIKIRTGLRIGAALDACEKSLEDWKRSYYKWYEVAKYKSV
jgi:hypothetical protein